jgi:formylglycine-generating enzyme required for sulfatase activity
MVFVEKGTFTMGRKLGRDDKDDVPVYDQELPAHSVTLTKDFYIGKFEVTQAVWKYFMSGNNPSNHRGDRYPVEYVSWSQVDNFLPALNTAFHAAYPEYINYEFRLPTEAQWEYAARGGNKPTNCPPDGCQYSGSNSITAVAWYDGNANATHEVGGMAANELGLHDMSGNVRELCSDLYDEDGSFPTSINNPIGAAIGSTRCTRGGYFRANETHCEVSFRGSAHPATRSSYIGFRLVLEQN